MNIFCRVGCECDKDFQNCLQKVNTTDSDAVYKLFYQIFDLDCIEEKCINSDGVIVPCSEVDSRNLKNPKQYFWSRLLTKNNLP